MPGVGNPEKTIKTRCSTANPQDEQKRIGKRRLETIEEQANAGAIPEPRTLIESSGRSRRLRIRKNTSNPESKPRGQETSTEIGGAGKSRLCYHEGGSGARNPREEEGRRGWLAGCFPGTLTFSLSFWKRELGVGAQEGEKLYICAGRRIVQPPGGETEDATARGAAMAMDCPVRCQLLGRLIFTGGHALPLRLYLGDAISFWWEILPWKNKCLPGKSIQNLERTLFFWKGDMRENLFGLSNSALVG